MEAKDCKTCGKTLPLSLYYKQSTTKDGLRSSCKSCLAEADKQWKIKNPEKAKALYERANKQPYRQRVAKDYRNRHRARTILRGAKQRADQYSLPYDLVESDLELPFLCPIMGLELDYTLTKIEDHSPSLDRILPELGYVKGNVQVISNLANRMKSNANKEQLLTFAEWINKTYGS